MTLREEIEEKYFQEILRLSKDSYQLGTKYKDGVGAGALANFSANSLAKKISHSIAYDLETLVNDQITSFAERVKVISRVSSLEPDGVTKEAFNQAKDVLNRRVDKELEALRGKE